MMTAGGTVYTNQPTLMLGDGGDGSVSGGGMLELALSGETATTQDSFQFILWPKILS